MKKNQFKHYSRKFIAVSAATAGFAELYNIFSTIFYCSFNYQSEESKNLALWLCLFLGVSFRFPSEYGLYYHNSFFKPAPSCVIEKNFLFYAECGVDLLSALITGGLTFDAVFGLLSDQLPHLQTGVTAMISSFFALSTAVAIFGVNHDNRFSEYFSNHQLITSEQQALLKKQTAYLNKMMLYFFALFAAIGYGLETIYDGQESLASLISTQKEGQLFCDNPLMDFHDSSQYISFSVVIILSLLMSCKTAVIEGLHVKQYLETYGQFSKGVELMFANRLLGCGNIIASLIDALPSLAAISTFPINLHAKLFVFTSLFILLGLSSSFVKGKYWRESIEELTDKIKGLFVANPPMSQTMLSFNDYAII